MGNIENEDTYFKGELIKTDKNEKHFINELVENKTLLYAGTKYHLASTFYDEKIDYLFIASSTVCFGLNPSFSLIFSSNLLHYQVFRELFDHLQL